MGSTNKKTSIADQIAAEAREQIFNAIHFQATERQERITESLILSAIEKATEEWRETNRMLLRKLTESRAAHASELKDDHGRSLKDIQEFERLSLERDDPTMISAAHASEPWTVEPVQEGKHFVRMGKFGTSGVIPTTSAIAIRNAHNATLSQRPTPATDE